MSNRKLIHFAHTFYRNE
jgi:hypothetical protein